MPMRHRKIIFFFLSAVVFSVPFRSFGSESATVWIFFRDKGPESVPKHMPGAAASLGISERALDRRARGFPGRELLDERDLPVCETYLSRLRARGLTPRVASRWLNAVSAVADKADLPAVASLPFVLEIRPVGSARILPPTDTPLPVRRRTAGEHLLNYGVSLDQNALIRVPELHDMGLSGKNTLIGLIDTGFDHPGRDIFSSLDVVAEYDFIWDDDSTPDGENDPAGQHNHGTQVLSVIGGYAPGILVGPAYGASYALAKTEWIASETRTEEDHWVAAIEWLEAIGCDIVSSSLGYVSFDDGFSYAYSDLDGNHCVTTLAADIAARKGVVVVSSAGNERNTPWHYITSPADGHEVIAVGAVYPDGEITGFSSVGPAADGRIKPDVMAMGSGVVSVSTRRGNQFSHSYVSGTSFSAPLVAGVCALLLEAHPGLTQQDVRETLKQTADRAANPDTLYGWGILNAHEAVFHHGPVLRNYQIISDVSASRNVFSMDLHTRNQVPPGRVVLYGRSGASQPFDSLQMTLRGTAHPYRYTVELPVPWSLDDLAFYFRVTDQAGRQTRTPFHAPDRLFFLSDTSGPGVPINIYLPEELALLPVYPNPFNTDVHIVFELPEAARVKLTVFDILGREVAVLIDRELSAGKKEVLWDGRDGYGMPCASGIYFCRLDAGTTFRIRKMVLTR